MIIVRLWLKREDTNPDPIRVMKYPSEIIKNRAPASAWVRFRSISMRGVRGAGAIRAIKFRKKMDVKSKSGPNWFRKEYAELFSLISTFEGCEDLSISGCSEAM